MSDGGENFKAQKEVHGNERDFEGEEVGRKINISGFSFMSLFNLEAKFTFMHASIHSFNKC